MQEEKAKVIQTLLFVAGINTLLQTLFGTRLPAVIGGSYTYVATTISIILSGRFSDEPDPIEVLLPERFFSINCVRLICLPNKGIHMICNLYQYLANLFYLK